MGWTVRIVSTRAAATQAAFASFLIGGCSLAIDTDQKQCERDADCEALGFEDMECKESLCTEREVVMTPFSCRNDELAGAGSSTLDFTMTVLNLTDQIPYEGLTVFSCGQFDAPCDNPLDQAVTDAAGSFTMEIAEGFRGHFSVPPPAGDPMLAPRIIDIFPPPTPGSTLRSDNFFVTSLAVVGGLTQLAGGTLVAGAGAVFFTVLDCNGDPLEGVSVSATTVLPETLIAYIGSGGQVDPTLLGTGPIGQGVLVNIPEGFISVRAVHETEGKLFEQATQVRADTITSIAAIVPSPVP